MEIKFYLLCLYSNLGVHFCVQTAAGVISQQKILCNFGLGKRSYTFPQVRFCWLRGALSPGHQFMLVRESGGAVLWEQVQKGSAGWFPLYWLQLLMNRLNRWDILALCYLPLVLLIGPRRELLKTLSSEGTDFKNCYYGKICITCNLPFKPFFY